MKILILTGVFPPDIGGPATQLDALIKELLKQNFQVRILAIGPKDRVKYNYPVIKISRRIPQPFRAAIFFSLTLIYSIPCQIIYIQDLYLPGYAGYLAKKILKKKLVTRFAGDSAWETALNQGETTDDILTFQKKKYTQKIEKLKERRKEILVESEAIIAVSNFMKDLAIKIGARPEKIKVIYNSVDFISLHDLVDKISFKKEMSLKDKVIVSAARLTPWKGMSTLIELMPELIEGYQEDISLVILGEGKEQKKLIKLVDELNLGQNVFLPGKVSHRELLNYFNSADVFVLNSNYEGLSHTILEAMKIGLPVITTNVGGNPEIVIDGQNGFLVNYNDKAALKDAIVKVLDDPEMAKSLAARAKKNLSKFNWQILVNETIKIFKNV